MTKIRPMHDYVLVKRELAEERTPGGILIPEDARERPQRGEVLAVGPGLFGDDGARIPLDVKAGDVVLFPKHVSASSVARVDLEPESPVLIRASELLAVLA